MAGIEFRTCYNLLRSQLGKNAAESKFFLELLDILGIVAAYNFLTERMVLCQSMSHNEWQVGGKRAIRTQPGLQAHAVSGISLELPLEYCNSRELFGTSRVQWAP